ncbi:MAG: N-acetyltransferase family protein [Pseudomonas sp.]|uniref:GNAT family N-acetyltransferase n=1 Tax=Pseudomonas sp. TaxID=306 RepID=UPI0033938DD0
MPLSPIVRDALLADLASVQAIYAWHVQHGLSSFETVPPTLEQIQQRHAEVRAQGLPFLVAEVAGEVVGYGYASPYRPRPAYRHTVEDSVYVRADRAGLGLGRALLAALIRRVELGDWRQMVAIVGNSENQGSIALHQALGFRQVGVFQSVGFKHGRWLDTVLMQRALGEGDSTPPEV